MQLKLGLTEPPVVRCWLRKTLKYLEIAYN